jgi:hypothetical protein
MFYHAQASGANVSISHNTAIVYGSWNLGSAAPSRCGTQAAPRTPLLRVGADARLGTLKLGSGAYGRNGVQGQSPRPSLYVSARGFSRSSAGAP